MPQDKIMSKTGNAPIRKTGHTAGRYGSGENQKVKGNSTTHDLGIK